MGYREKRLYLKAILERYKMADRQTKKQILDEFCSVCNYNRKYAIGLLNKPLGGGRKAKR